jgi:protein SCO1/2
VGAYPAVVRSLNRILLPLLAAAALIAVVVAVALGGSGGRGAAVSTAGAQAGFEGAALPPGAPTPGFTLHDQAGRPVSLASTRGGVTVLTFLYADCGAACTLIAQQVRGALDELAHPPRVLIVSADPAGESPAAVRRFLASVSLSGRVSYLSGPAAQLRAIWRAYGVTPPSAGRAAFARTASVLLLDRHGRRRVLFQQEQLTPEALAHDVGKLEGEPTHP